MIAPHKNARTGLLLSVMVVSMLGLSFAAVPLYRLFCQVTGYGGTTQLAESLPAAVSERTVVVRFNADTDHRLPWSFQPVQKEVTLRVGESGLAFYRARNDAKQAITGMAVFNVSPQKAGLYFNKIQCFCFDQQRLEPGQEIDMAVTFFVDPAIETDPNLDDVKTITLSYTFFRDPDDEGAESSSAMLLGGPATAHQQAAALR
jgi:cytochrome c oxidase assembly protein subunit 11